MIMCNVLKLVNYRHSKGPPITLLRLYMLDFVCAWANKCSLIPPHFFQCLYHSSQGSVLYLYLMSVFFILNFHVYLLTSQ